VVATFVLASALVGGCRRSSPPPFANDAAVAEAPVPAPDGLVVEAIVRAPDAIFEGLHAASALVPTTAAPALTDLLHVDRDVADEVDGGKPASFLLARRQATNLYVLCLKLRDQGRAQAALSKVLARREDPALGLVIFEASGATAGPRTQVLALRGGFLLAASSVEALAALAPYATRTMPTRPLPSEEIAITLPKSGLRGPLREALRTAIDEGAARRKLLVEKSKAGAVATAAPSVGLIEVLSEYFARSNARVLGWLDDADDARVTISTRGGAIAVRGELDAAPGSRLAQEVASWSVGDGTIALDVPAAATLAFASRASDATRAEASRDLSAVIGALFPADLDPAARAKLDAWLSSWDAARGLETTGAVIYGGPSRFGVTLRLEAKDSPALAKLLRDGLRSILALRGVGSGLEKNGIKIPAIATEKIAGLEATVLSIKLPKGKASSAEPDSVEIVWAPIPGAVALVAGAGARALLGEIVSAGPTLATTARPREAVAALGPSLSGIVVALPGRVVPIIGGSEVLAQAPPDDPVVFAIGRGVKGPRFALDVSKQALELAGRFALRTLIAGP
jgi:hypothetical protein